MPGVHATGAAQPCSTCLSVVIGAASGRQARVSELPKNVEQLMPLAACNTLANQRKTEDSSAVAGDIWAAPMAPIMHCRSAPNT